METDGNKRVAKNTIILYCRLFVTLVVGLWTSRVILNSLGFVDNGLYNVVGGFVGFFYIISNAQSNAISRFLTFEIGRGNTDNLNKVFHSAITIQLLLSVVIIIFAETLGLWFLNHKLVIPADRYFAVNIVYQLSVLTMVLGIMSISQNALIIAHEKMNIYAMVSIVTSFAKLGISFMIYYASCDKLILYASLLCLLSIGSFVFYVCYSRVKFPFCTYHLSDSKDYFRSMFGYASWSFVGESAGVLRSSGISVILNLFGGPIANTVNGIAMQVSSLANMFVNDFSTAFNPQITKRYASKEYESLIIYLYRCSKFSYLLMLLIAIPLLFNIDFLLNLWLKAVPDETQLFTQIVICYSLIESISKPLITAKSATGNIRNYQIIVGGILLLSLPLAYFFLKFGFPIYYSYVALLITSVFAFITRMLLLNGSIPLWDTSHYLVAVVLPLLGVTVLTTIVPFVLKNVFNLGNWSMLSLSIIWVLAVIIIVGCNKDERAFISTTLKTVFPFFK